MEKPEEDANLITKFQQRADGWGFNDDGVWVKVKLGEMRAVLRALRAIRNRKGA